MGTGPTPQDDRPREERGTILGPSIDEARNAGLKQRDSLPREARRCFRRGGRHRRVRPLVALEPRHAHARPVRPERTRGLKPIGGSAKSDPKPLSGHGEPARCQDERTQRTQVARRKKAERGNFPSALSDADRLVIGQGQSNQVPENEFRPESFKGRNAILASDSQQRR